MAGATQRREMPVDGWVQERDSRPKSAQGAPISFPGWSPQRSNDRQSGAAPVGVEKQTRELGFWAVVRGQDQGSTRVEMYPLERGCPTPRLDRLPKPPGS